MKLIDRMTEEQKRQVAQQLAERINNYSDDLVLWKIFQVAFEMQHELNVLRDRVRRKKR